MKNGMMKWLMVIVSFGLMMANDAYAAFRVKTPTAAVRQQALMAIQSVGTVEDETVETTTKEKPFTVDFATLGMENPTNAYLLIVNEQTGNAVALEASDPSEMKLELPPLALAELEMQNLGASQQYRCMTLCATASGNDEMVGSQKLASSLGEVVLPQFNYRTDDGDVKLTCTSDRKLVNVAKNYRNYSMLDPSDPVQQSEMRRLEKEEAYFTYVYQMPNGSYYVYDEETATKIGGETESVTLGNLTFTLQVDGADKVKNATADQVKKAITYACSIWAKAVKGSCPIAMSITFTDDFSSDYTLADSRTPPSSLENGILYQSTLYNQMQGKDAYPSNYDVTLRFNTKFTDATWCKNTFGVDATYYFGLDKKVGSSQQDFVTVVLHEICHGMGFAGNIAYAPGYWYNGCFVWTQVDGSYVGDSCDYPNVFSQYLSCNGTRLADMSWENRAAAVVSNNLYWDGPNVKKHNNGNRVKMYAPTTYQGGSSVSHWDDVVMNSYDVFMTWQHHYPLHEVAPLEKMMMKDLGWTLTDDTPAKPAAPTGVSATKGTIVGEVDVTWSAVSGATSYTVYRSTSASGTYSAVKTGLTTCKYQDKSVSGTTTYYYKVAAVNSAGTSAQSSYAYGYAKAETVLTSISVTGSATLNSGEYADYTCTAYYSDGSSKAVSTDSGCTWTLPYGSSYATQNGRRLTAGNLTEQKSVTIRASYGGKTAEYSVTILPKTLTVTFESGSYGTASFTSRAYAVGGKYGTLPAVSNVAYGYTFSGWYTASSGGTLILSSSTVSASITKLYAHYSAKGAVTSVRTDAPSTIECGTTRMVYCYVTYDTGLERRITASDCVTWSIAMRGIPYTFTDGGLLLSPSATGAGRIYVMATVNNISSPQVLITAVNPIRTVTLNANEGSVSPASIDQKEGTAFSSLPTPTRAGYRFLGWFTASSGGTQIQNGTVYNGSYTTLYARWEYIVLLDHIAISGSSSVTSGEAATYSCSAYFNNGTSQSGVSTSWSASKGSITSGGVFTAPTVTASQNMTITASYTWGGATKTATKSVTVNPKTVTVTFNPNGGSVSPTSKQFTVGLAYGTLPTPTWSGYDFKGWYTSSVGGSQVTASTVATESITAVYARWEKIVVLSSVAIGGASSVVSGGTATYACTANFSDGSSMSNVSAAWSASNGSITSGGVFTAPTVTANTTVTISASYTSRGVTKTATRSVTVTPKKVTVAFNANSGTVSPASQQFTVGLKYGTLPTPTRANWDFKGWFTAASGGIQVTVNTVAAESLTVLYAHWEKTLSSIAISGSASVVSSSANDYICTATWSDGTTTEGVAPAWSASAGTISAAGRFTAPTVTANTSVTISASYTSKGVTKTATKSVTVTPKKVTVTFDPNGGSVSPATKQFTVGLAYGSLPVPTKSGYEFKGWFTALSGGTEVIASTVATESLTTVHARWEYIVVLSSVTISGTASVDSGGTATYTCTASFSDGTSQTGVSVLWNTSAGSITSGGVFTAPTVTAGTTASISASYTWNGTTKTATKSVTVTPKKVTVTFNANGGTVSPASKQFTVGLAYGTLPTPSKSGWDFKGWFTALVGGTQVTASTVATESLTTIFARWEKTLSSIAIAGETSVVSGSTNTYVCTATYSDGSMSDGVSATWTATSGLIDDAGRFVAPVVAANSRVTLTASYASKGVTKTVTKTVTVTPKTLTVTFNANGGSVSPASKQFTVGFAYGTLPTPTWSGYVFDGWFTALDESGVPVMAATSVIEGVTTLYAKWHEEVVLRGLTILGPTSVESGGTATYVCRANYSDGSTAILNPSWSITSGGSYATLTSDGVLTAKSTAASRTVVVRATFSGLSTTITIVIRPKTVTVAFDAHGGTVSEASHAYVVGTKYGAFPSVECVGHRFLGWFTAATGGTRVLETSVVTVGVTVLHAQWQENPPALKDVWIVCEENPAAVVSGSTLELTCVASYTNGATTVTNALNGANVTWMTDDASVGTVAGGVFTAARVTSPSIAIITAQYQGMTSPEFSVWVEPEYVTVGFDANGGTVSEQSRRVAVGAAYGELPVPTYDAGHRFDGWFTAADGGARVTEVTVCEKTVTTLYAHWTEVVHLTALRIEGENVVTSSVPATFTCYGVFSDASELLVSPTWEVADPAQGLIDSEGVFMAAYVVAPTSAVIRAVSEGVTGMVEVVIMPMEVSVRFDPCNGAVTPQRMTFIVGASYGELPTPVRNRYDFDGWYTREGKAGDLITSSSTVSKDVETLYAGWTPTPLSLTGIRIEGVEAVTSGGGAVFSCKAVYSDGTEGSIVPAWSLMKGLDYASLTMSGFFEAVEVSSAQTVTIQAVYTDKGIRYEDQHVVTIMPSTLVVDPGTKSLEAGAQSASILVDSYGSWRVSVDVGWITLGKTSGTGIDTVDFTVTANTGNDERIGTITVTSDGLTETCVVKQYSPIPDEYVMVTLNPQIPGQAASQRQYVKGRKFAYLPTPVRTGYAFGGWWTQPNGAGTRVHAMSVVTDETLTLHGYWTDVSVAYALNNALDWVEDATHPWSFDYTDAMDRKVSMTTPAIGNCQSSSLTALVEGPGSISFYWKTSSEEFFDTLVLYVDGKYVASLSGETGWQSFSKAISGYGQHAITWTYVKDGQGAGGMDCAWLDMVTWIPDYAGSGAASIQAADGRSVPETWLNAHGLDTGASSLDEDADGDGMTNYAEYIAGTDPLDAESKFLIYIEMGTDGRPQIGAIPDLGDTATRTYILEGKENLSDADWMPANDSVHHFFRARIEVK